MAWLSLEEMKAVDAREASAHDRWRGGFLYSVSCLEFETLGYSLGILVRVDIDNPEPAHPENVDAVVSVRGTIDTRVFCGPSQDDRGVMRQPFHPHVMDCQRQSRREATEALEPAANRVAVMTLTGQSMGSVKAMMKGGDAVFEQGVKVFLIDSFEVLPGDPLHDGVVHTASSTNPMLISFTLD
jgi:hypothetical protein